MAVRPIPEGQHTITAHVVINGNNAAKAIEFYKAAFGFEECLRMNMPDGKIMHAELQLGDSKMFLCDDFGQNQAVTPAGVSLHICVADCDAFFNRAVKAGAKVKMPLQNMFWGDRYGQLTDPFGHTWAVSTHVEDVSPAEMTKRGQEMMSKMGQCS